jgi:hypothetical protein
MSGSPKSTSRAAIAESPAEAAAAQLAWGGGGVERVYANCQKSNAISPQTSMSTKAAWLPAAMQVPTKGQSWSITAQRPLSSVE